MPPGVNAADTAWMLAATALVLLMTPALGLFYAGLVRAKNTLNTFMMCIAALAVATITWALVGYSLAFASGNGVIEKAGWESGYGKYIRVRHNNGYETAYGHMTAFARGMDEGTRVRQGQVIGFVGSTGLSTGSHLHYEILVNGRFVDPMRIKLPRGRVLEGALLANFDKERERLDGIMARKPARVASSAPVTR